MNNKQPMMPPTRSSIGPLAVWVIVVAGLYFAQDVVIPLALALLITFMLAPVVSRLERWHFGRVPSVVLVILTALAIVGGMGYLVANQFVDLAGKLPSYKQTVVHKIQKLRPTHDGRFGRAREALEDFSREVTSGETTATVSTTTATAEATQTSVSATDDKSTGSAFAKATVQANESAASDQNTSAASDQNTSATRPQKPEPIPVTVVQTSSNMLEALRTVLGPVFSWFGTAALVLLFVLFMLLQRDDLRDRVIRLAGQKRIQVTTEAFDEAGRRVSRYLLMQLIVNVTYGVPVAIGLYCIGLPNALLWGVFATILRFIPYLGPWIAATIPILLSIAVFDSWTPTFFTIGLYVVMELISNNFLEPLLYGHTTGVSPVAIILSAVFWTWLWGVVGLLLSTPITVCLMVLGRHVPQMAYLNVLLGDQPVLPPESKLYNRLLADDLDDALEIAEHQLQKHSLVEVYDSILVPALGLAEHDRHEGALPIEKQKLIWSGMAEMIEAFADRSDADEAKKTSADNEPEASDATKARLDLTRASLPSRKILCLPARDHADELAASMLAQILVRAHHTVRVVSVETFAGEMVEQVKEFEPDVVCISALPPLATTHARYLCKRVKAEVPNARVMVGLWNAEGNSVEALKRLEGSGVDVVVKSIQEAVGRV
ncbi:MAG: AI-2E family transporter [Candidatus Sumerlaeaceae bacterium]